MSWNREQIEDAEANASISFHEVDNNLKELELSDREETEAEYEKLQDLYRSLNSELREYAYALRDI